MNIDYSKVKKISINQPLKLDCGIVLNGFMKHMESLMKQNQMRS
jgi:hypothetical protein